MNEQIKTPAEPSAPALSVVAGSDSSEREPDGFCVWCSAPYYVGDPTYAHPQTREVHCTRECCDEHDANL